MMTFADVGKSLAYDFLKDHGFDIKDDPKNYVKVNNAAIFMSLKKSK